MSEGTRKQNMNQASQEPNKTITHLHSLTFPQAVCIVVVLVPLLWTRSEYFLLHFTVDCCVIQPESRFSMCLIGIFVFNIGTMFKRICKVSLSLGSHELW